MKTFLEYTNNQKTSNLDEGKIGDIIRAIGSGIKKYGGKIAYGAGHILSSGLSGLAHGAHGYGRYRDSDYDPEYAEWRRRRREQEDSEQEDSDTTGSGTPPTSGGSTGSGTPPTSGGSTGSGTPPTSGGSTLTGAEKKRRREASRPGGRRLGRIETTPSGVRAARTDPERKKLAARGEELEGRRAAIQTVKGGLRKGTTAGDVRNFNIGLAMTKAGEVEKARESMGLNPELTQRLRELRIRTARRRARLADTGTTPAERGRAVMGAYESTDFLNSVLHFINK